MFLIPLIRQDIIPKHVFLLAFYTNSSPQNGHTFLVLRAHNNINMSICFFFLIKPPDIVDQDLHGFGKKKTTFKAISANLSEGQFSDRTLKAKS
jgi:hypothetical protein